MRDVYRGLGVLAAAAVVVAGVIMVLPSRPDEVPARPIAAPSAAPSPSGPTSSPGPAGTLPTASAVPTASGAVPSASAPAGVPTTSETAAAMPSGSPPGAVPSASALMGRPTPTPGATLAPGYTAMEAFYADARIARLPGSIQPVPASRVPRYVVKDTRTGLAVPRLGRPWKLYGPAPFTTRQVLPKHGAGLRGLLVSCPLPIERQQDWRDTALLAARWTLTLHPKGATIRWIASQSVDRGWMLIYQVKYGKHASRAAVAVLDGGMAKPGLVFVSVPDTQRKQWGDVQRVASGVRVLG
ncbi:hypothetical protein ACIBHX_00645 [Nonomuraea sp. NPDC050536]|uniref:hypothetical protein n=1 Tax=Nonomuraea sp. NPDC050536 TaxID=3364366 RepID=UPI0037CC298B